MYSAKTKQNKNSKWVFYETFLPFTCSSVPLVFEKKKQNKTKKQNKNWSTGPTTQNSNWSWKNFTGLGPLDHWLIQTLLFGLKCDPVYLRQKQSISLFWANSYLISSFSSPYHHGSMESCIHQCFQCTFFFSFFPFFFHLFIYFFYFGVQNCHNLLKTNSRLEGWITFYLGGS